MTRFKGSVTTMRNGKKYHYIFCGACGKASFLYPDDPKEADGFCENPKCGVKESFRVERSPNPRKGKQ